MRCLQVAALCLLAVSGCSRSKAEQERASASGYEKLELRFEGFSGMVGFPELAQDLGYLAPLELIYVGSTIGGPHSIQSVVTGDTDFGGAFNGAVIKLVAAKAPIISVIGYYGSDELTFNGFYVLENSPIKSARDLIGKRLALNTLGAHAEFMTKEYLHRQGLSKQEIAQVMLVPLPPASTEQALRQKQVDVASLGQIFREKAVERGGIRTIFTDRDLFGSFTAGSLVMSKKFLRDNPNTARKFVQATSKAIEWARNSPRAEVIARMQKILKLRSPNESPETLKYWRSTTVANERGVISDKEFQVWIDWLVREGELAPGQVKARDLYTNDFQ
jgi:ABC-type nitrate/sulfonate/bicarbonate transport system substrate-binding protein